MQISAFKGFLIPIVCYLLLKYYRIKRLQRVFANRFPGFTAGESELIGDYAEWLKSPSRYLLKLHSRIQFTAVGFVRGDYRRPRASLSTTTLVKNALGDNNGPSKFSEAFLAKAHALCIKRALHELRNWDLGAVQVDTAVTDLVLETCGDLLLDSVEWRREAGKIRALCVAPLQAIPPAFQHRRMVASVLLGSSFPEPIMSPIPELRAVLASLGCANESMATLFYECVNITRSLLTWSLFFLGGVADAQSEVVKAIDNKVGRRVPPTFEEANQLNVLATFLRETMRARSPMVFKDMVLQEGLDLGNTYLPAGTEVVLAIDTVNADQSVFDSGNGFDPNWLELHSSGTAQGVVLPPSDALPLSLTLVSAILVVLLQRFSVNIDTQFAIEEDIVEGISVPNVVCKFVPRPTPSTL